MKNKKGFTLVELLATIIVIGLIMALILPSATRLSNENKETIYHTYEEMVEEYAAVSEYKNQYYIDIDDLDELSKVKNECTGYVLIDHETSPNNYKAYLSCGEQYQTEGYADSATSTKTIVDIPKCKTNVIYNAEDQALVTLGAGFVLSNEQRKNVGSQNVRASLVNKNIYAWEDSSQDDKLIRNCEIKRRPIEVIADDKTMRHGENGPALTYHLSNDVSIESPLTSAVTFIVKNSSGEVVSVNSTTPVGTYSITPNAEVSDNYTKSMKSGTLTVLQSLFVITLNNNSATSAGTQRIYEFYNVGWYSTSSTSSENVISSITIPYKDGYIFDGYYTEQDGEGTQIINSVGTILADTKQYEENSVLYAKWNECGNGNYCKNNIKTACPAGTYGNGTTNASSQSAACSACGNGYWCTGGTARSACPAGTYGNGTTNASSQSAACSACGNGYWCTGGASRSACPAGTYGNGTTNASTQAAACQNCGNGYYCTGGTARTACPAGYYGNGATTASTQTAACQNCGNGYYCTGGTARAACAAGKYGKGNNNARNESEGCQNCGNGAWCTGGNARSTCPAGTYGNGVTTASSQAAACQNCGNGAWCTGGTARSTCPAGYYGNGTTTASSQSAACSACGKGYWCTGGTARSSCPAGYYGNGATTASSQSAACSACGNGYWCTGVNARSACPAGYYGNGTTTASSQSGACRACGNGAWCTGGNARSTCPAGYYGNGATTASSQGAACQNCGNGYYCTGGTARAACVAGKYGKGNNNARNESEGCQNCGNGYWCTGVNARSGCPAGYYGNGATTASSQGAACSACGAGYACSGVTNRTTCNNGKYSTSSTASSCSTCPTYYYSGSGASTSCYDNTSPTANAWTSTSQASSGGSYTLVTSSSATARICNLGSDTGNGLKTMYYRTSCTSSWSSASISGGCATISISTCRSGTLYYYLSDGRNNSSTIGVGNIGKYLIIGMVYNQILYRGASNNNNEVGHHVNLSGSLLSIMTGIANGSESHSTNNGQNNTTFVRRLYYGLLGRGADSGGLNNWVNILNSGTSRDNVVNSLANSSEAAQIRSAWGY